MDAVEKIAEAVLYEGYLLFPYRRSSMKNQQRWTFGCVYPRAYSEASRGDDPWVMQTQCLVLGTGATKVEIKVRFLQVLERNITEKEGNNFRPVESLRVGDQVYQPWEEAMERSVIIGDEEPLYLGDLISQTRCFPIHIAAGSEEEPLTNAEGEVVGAIVREWSSLQGEIEVLAEPVSSSDLSDLPHSLTPPLSHSPILLLQPSTISNRLTVRIRNSIPWTSPQNQSESQLRNAVLKHTFVSTHTILRVQDGEFVSLLEPPEEYEGIAKQCENIKTWPVLVGDPTEKRAILSSPIILYDYPQVSPESHGNFFDGTEIDELLTLSVLTLSDEEKREMRETDARSREILERTESLSPEELMQLHGTVRSLQFRSGGG